mmetsp:Transcript_110066/g.350592  ORF Transcript_110066/g.350592 Transcript_110066/m.350592 type:complete len:268 (-) Transcript_110066:215-1018(-)
MFDSGPAPPRSQAPEKVWRTAPRRASRGGPRPLARMPRSVGTRPCFAAWSSHSSRSVRSRFRESSRVLLAGHTEQVDAVTVAHAVREAVAQVCGLRARRDHLATGDDLDVGGDDLGVPEAGPTVVLAFLPELVKRPPPRRDKERHAALRVVEDELDAPSGAFLHVHTRERLRTSSLSDAAATSASQESRLHLEQPVEESNIGLHQESAVLGIVLWCLAADGLILGNPRRAAVQQLIRQTLSTGGRHQHVHENNHQHTEHPHAKRRHD